MDVDSSCIHNYQNLEAINMSLNRWMDKQIVVQMVEYYSALKMVLLSHNKIWSNLKWILLSKRSQYENAMNYAIPIVCDTRKSKTLETVKRSAVAGTTEEKMMNKWNTGHLYIFQTTLNTRLMVNCNFCCTNFVSLFTCFMISFSSYQLTGRKFYLNFTDEEIWIWSD